MRAESMIAPVGAPRLKDYGRMLRASWALILAATVLSLAGAWLATSLVAPSYTASSRVFVSAPGPTTTRAAMEGNRSSMMRVESYVQLTLSEQVLRRVIVELGLPMGPAELKRDVVVTPMPGSALFDITATSDSGEQARDIANSLATNLIQLVEEIDLGANGPVSDVTLIDAAAVPEPESTLVGNLIVGGGMGLVVSCVLVIASGVRRDAIDHRDEVEYIIEKVGVSRR
jgi:capsular polysaccharide biosynthesis protein